MPRKERDASEHAKPAKPLTGGRRFAMGVAAATIAASAHARSSARLTARAPS